MVQIKKITLSDSGGKVLGTHTDFVAANQRLYSIIRHSKISDAYYKIDYEDGVELTGSIDLEPLSFWETNGSGENPFSWHLKTFWGNVSKLEKQEAAPKGLYDIATIEFAEKIVSYYVLEHADEIKYPAESSTFLIKFHEEELITPLHEFLLANMGEDNTPLTPEEIVQICKLKVGEKVVFNFTTMTTCTLERVEQPVSNTISNLLKQMGENTLWAWEPTLEENKEVIILEDFNNKDDEGNGEIVIYNGWFENLKGLAIERNTSWIETHHEVVSYITTALNIMDTTVVEPTVVKQTMEQQGTGGIYELAEKWTNEFELEHAGREWDGEFWDEIEAWLEIMNNKV